MTSITSKVRHMWGGASALALRASPDIYIAVAPDFVTVSFGTYPYYRHFASLVDNRFDTIVRLYNNIKFEETGVWGW